MEEFRAAYERARRRDARTVCVCGFLVVCLLGGVSHFFYDWSGENAVAGIFFPANESVWEHMKLVFFPAVVFFAVALPLSPRLHNRIYAAFCATYIAAGFIPVAFYIYTYFAGKSVLAVDIVIFIIGAALGFAVAYRAFTVDNSALLFWLGTVGIAAIMCCYLSLTAFVPDFFLFIDPSDGSSGLQRKALLMRELEMYFTIR